MPQRSVTTSSPLGYTIATLSALVSSLQASMVAGQSIVAADIISIKTGFYDLWRVHTHTASDRQGIDTFGNLTVYGVAGTDVTKSSSAPVPNTPYVTPTFAAGQSIDAADINGMILIVNGMRNHNHTIDDGIGATGPVVAIGAATYFGTNFGATATATLTLANDGQLFGADAGSIGGQWINMRPVDLATAASYDVMVTHTGGTAPTGSPTATWLNLGTSRSWSVSAPYVGGSNVVTSNLSVQIRNATTLAVVGGPVAISIVADSEDVPFFTCFPAGSHVLMGDGTWRLIQQLHVGDVVMGVNGPTPVIKMERPMLGSRKILKFADGSLRWSEEHAMWTKNEAGSQWWWSSNSTLWKKEAVAGAIGGLTDNDSMRTGDQATAWAHVDGWKSSDIVVETGNPFNTRLFLPVTNGSPIIVNGYVVSAGVNQTAFDYTQLDWDVSRAALPVVQPLPTV